MSRAPSNLVFYIRRQENSRYMDVVMLIMLENVAHDDQQWDTSLVLDQETCHGAKRDNLPWNYLEQKWSIGQQQWQHKTITSSSN